MGDFNKAELHAISQMMRARKTLPDDFLGVPAVQELACLFAKIEPLLNDAQKATMIGCGAMLCHYSEAEMRADIEAGMALARARNQPHD